MSLQSTAHMLAWYTRAVVLSSVSRVLFLHFPTWVHTCAMVAAVMMLLAGCGDGGDDGHVPEDDFIVSFPSLLEIFIRRPFDQPFRVLEVGVTPFVSPGLGREPYVLVVSGIALSDGVEIVFEAQDAVRREFVDPLEERVIDVLIACDCFVDYVILRSSFGETTIIFD